MNSLKFLLRSQRGFLLFSTIFLTLITASSATILINAAPRLNNAQSVLRLTAVHLANEQLAILEGMAAQGDSLEVRTSFQGDVGELITGNYSDEVPIEFSVTTEITPGDYENLRGVEVTVSWKFAGEDYDLKLGRTVRVGKNESEGDS